MLWGGNEQPPKEVKQKKTNTNWKRQLNNNVKDICCVPSFVHFQISKETKVEGQMIISEV